MSGDALNQTAKSSQRWSPTFMILLAAAVLAAIYFGRDILLPIALALLVCFILAPLVRILERRGLGRIPSVAIVVVVSLGLVAAAAWMLVVQVVDLNSQLPKYKKRLVSHLEELPFMSGGFNNGSNTIQEIIDEVSKDPKEKEAEENQSWLARIAGINKSNSEANPQKVEVVKLPGSELEQIRNMLGPLVAPLSTLGIVLISVVFVLISKDNLRDRFIYLIGKKNLLATTKALDDAVKRLSRFLLMQLILNVCYGCIVGIVLTLAGVPNAILWGVFTIGLKFLPFLGPWIAAGLPTLLSLAVFDTWTVPLIVIGTFVVLELLTNNVFEPLMFGTSMGVSETGIIVSVVFWTFMWGPVGLLVAMPLTVCLVVLGRHVPQLRFLDLLLGKDAGMPPESVMYQRLLAGDEHEAQQIATRFLTDKSREEFVDEILLPVLNMTEIDRHAASLSDEEAKTLVDMLTALSEVSLKTDSVDDRPLIQNANPDSLQVVVVPASDHSDRAAGELMAETFRRRFPDVVVLSDQLLVGEVLEQIVARSPDLIFISAMPPVVERHSRYLCKRIQTEHPEIPVIVGLWLSHNDTRAPIEERLLDSGACDVVHDMKEAAEAVHQHGEPVRVRRVNQFVDENQYADTVPAE